MMFSQILCHPERSEGPAFFSSHKTAGPSLRSG
jgi:hypothetical protein